MYDFPGRLLGMVQSPTEGYITPVPTSIIHLRVSPLLCVHFGLGRASLGFECPSTSTCGLALFILNFTQNPPPGCCFCLFQILRNCFSIGKMDF